VICYSFSGALAEYIYTVQLELKIDHSTMTPSKNQNYKKNGIMQCPNSSYDSLLVIIFDASHCNMSP